MFKAINVSLLTLTVATILLGCGKKDAGAPETAATPVQPPAAAAAPAEAHPLPSTAPSDVDLTGIAKAEGGKTVEEVFNEKDALANQRISLRGKVVKVNANIMGTNWLHVRDGSGTEGSNDLTVTTSSALPEVGDTVLVPRPGPWTIAAHQALNENARNLRCGHFRHQAPGFRSGGVGPKAHAAHPEVS